MSVDVEKSFVMAKHLKQLREEKGLSHDKLSKALHDQYDVKISSDSLMNYEVADKNHSKALKNQGMRVEYLRCLADFYKVSTDYLLGLTEIKSPDYSISATVQITGLTEENVIALALAKRISQTYIPAYSQEGTGIPLRSYMPPADATETYNKFVERTGILNFFLPKDQTAGRVYLSDSRSYDEMVLELLTHFSDCINDLISASLQDWSITANHKAILADYPHENAVPDFNEFANDYKMATSKGYAFTPSREYRDYKVAKVGSSITQFLTRKYETDGND